MGEPATKVRYTYEQYLAIERETDTRYEWLHGEIWAMSGGTPRHSKVKTNLTRVVGAALRGLRCQPYDCDLKVRNLDTGLATYPDLSVVCGPLGLHPEDKNAITNPSLVAEVLSPGTERWDRGGKFAHYRRLASLEYVIFIDPDVVGVELYSRDEMGWELREYGPGAGVALPKLGVTLAVDEIFEQLPDVPTE